MTTIYMIRHAEAEGNLYRRCQGQFDARVTARGMQQIDALAERFRSVHLDALYSSDLLRTRTTAGAITRTHPELQLQLDPRLRELRMGAWEDQPWGNMERDTPELVKCFSADPERWIVPGAETFEQLGDRMLDCVTELAKRHDGQTIAVVSHGMAIRTLLCRLLDIPSQETPSIPHGDNTSVHILSWDGEKLRVVRYNDNSHLPAALSPFARQSWWKNISGVDSCNLNFRPLDPMKDARQYLDFYADSWRCAHGDLSGFAAESYWEMALEDEKKDPEAILFACMGAEPVGLLHLDPQREAQAGVGWISLFYLTEKLRGKGFAVQLLGQCLSTYRRLGRHKLGLYVAEENTAARAFYQRNGFVEVGQAPGACGTLYRMERDMA